MSMHNAVMYLQNVLVAIQMEINCKVRYSVFFKFIARSNILSMQNSYDEAYTKSTGGAQEQSEEKEDKSGSYGDDNFKFELPDFPLTQGALSDF